MRAVMFRGPENPVTLETVPDPTPGPGEMVLKVGRCGICGSDVSLTQMDGFYPRDSALGHEFCGEVVAMGSGVEGFDVGDVVTALPASGCGHCKACVDGLPLFCPNGITGASGAFADFVRVNASVSVKLPSTLTMADGAMIEPLAVGLHGVNMAQMEAGARVLVTGAGGIGLAAVHFARLMGAGKIAVIARSRRGEEMARKMGADAFVTTGDNEVGEVIEALGGSPDVVYESIGAVGGLQQAINHVRIDGTVISLGFCTSPDPILPSITTFKQVHLLFSMAYSLREFQVVADMLDRGHVEPRAMLGKPIPLESVPDMIVKMRTEKPVEAKVQCDPSL
jgi:threonine dehydrogenase-like Zn-dependent dehydrogenase